MRCRSCGETITLGEASKVPVEVTRTSLCAIHAAKGDIQFFIYTAGFWFHTTYSRPVIHFGNRLKITTLLDSWSLAPYVTYVTQLGNITNKCWGNK